MSSILPQLNGQTVITDGGLETTLIFEDGMELPEFCSFPLVLSPEGRERLDRYSDDFVSLAEKHSVPVLLETPTWRASKDWVEKLGLGSTGAAAINRQAMETFSAYRERNADRATIVLSGCVGPRGDGYVAGDQMSADQAADYHREQIETHARSQADLVSAYTLNYVDEAIGIARVAATANIPAVISFTVETDGRLPSGQPLGEAIEEVDASTNSSPAYYMINCAHPTHFAETLAGNAAWLARLGGLRANASMKSHEELDAMTELDSGDPNDFASRLAALREALPALNVLGGCCGTDRRHTAAVCERCL